MHLKKFLSIQILLAQFIAIFIWFLVTVVQWTNNPKTSHGLSIPLIVTSIECRINLFRGSISMRYCYES